MYRFFVDKSDVGDTDIYLRNEADIEHLRKSLRATLGMKLSIADSSGWVYICSITGIEKDVIVLRIEDKSMDMPESHARISLFQSIPKSTKMDDVVRKTVEMGVYEIFPIFTDRTIVSDKGRLAKKVERWNGISLSAAKQSGRAFVPLVHEPLKGQDILNTLSSFDIIIFPYENEKCITLKDVFQSSDKFVNMSFAVIIGPEGGFSDNEANALIDIGARACSLGAGILRTESAAFAALAMMRYEMDM